MSERVPTPEQAAAIEATRLDVLLEAGAGTGKTGVMACKDHDTGLLVRDATYDDGHEAGLVRNYYPTGQLKRVTYFADAAGESASAKRLPASVSDTLRVVRMKSCTFSRVSSPATE